MRDKIVAALRRIEQEHDCRVLFAVESGSRAWGFASPDSDYDVRAVYVKPLDWYLQVEEPASDTITAMLPDDLDVVAWDLRKFLKHFSKSNASVLEWLGSPIVYADSGLIGRLKDLMKDCVEPVHVAFHYASMFRHAMSDQREDGTVSVKKLCYALRANLCVRWVVEKGTMPPTAFADVRSGVSLPDRDSHVIEYLLERKNSARESDRVVPPDELKHILEDGYEKLRTQKWSCRSSLDALPVLTKMFRDCVKRNMG